MTPRYVYILSTYEEHGSFGAVATLDRTKLLELLEAQFKVWDFRDSGFQNDARKGLAFYLAQDDATLATGDAHNLEPGWGGATLHVLELK